MRELSTDMAEASEVRFELTCDCGRHHEIRVRSDSMVFRQPVPGPRLSARQTQVLALAADGLTDLEIANQLGMSLDCVKREIRTSLVVLSARNRTEAVVAAIRIGAVPLERALE